MYITSEKKNHQLETHLRKIIIIKGKYRGENIYIYIYNLPVTAAGAASTKT